MQLLPMLPALLHHRLVVVIVDTLGILPASFLHQPSQRTPVNVSSIPWVPPSVIDQFSFSYLISD